MFERQYDGTGSPAQGQSRTNAPVPLQPASADETVAWESAITSDDLPYASDATASTEDLVGGGADEFFGFEDTVTVSDEKFAASRPPLRSDDVLAQRKVDTGSFVPATGTKGTAIFDEPLASEDATQVMRRSLLNTPDTAPAFHEAVPAVHTSAPSFEDAMATPVAEPSIDVSVLPVVPSRGWPRAVSLILSLVFVPIAWYLVVDAGARLVVADGAPMQTGTLNIAALGELVAGLIAIAIIGILAAQSSLGLIVTGTLVMLMGVPFLVDPLRIATEGAAYLQPIATYNPFGRNVVTHFLNSGFTGAFVALGFFMIALGWALAAVRRTGRREEALRVTVAAANPAGLHARWSRKATEQAQSLR